MNDIFREELRTQAPFCCAGTPDPGGMALLAGVALD